jgi:hypothetical protein
MESRKVFEGVVLRNKFNLVDAIRIISWRLQWFVSEKKFTESSMAQKDPHHPEVAVCAIAVGYEYLGMSMLMIKSLRRNGLYTGPIYIFTDNPGYFSECDNVLAIQIPSNISTMAVKQYKTWLTECVSFQYLLYIDTDIVIGKSIKYWIESARNAADQRPLVLFWDHASTGKYYHSGVIFLNRTIGRKVLFRWRRQIWCKGYSRDQRALNKTIRSEKDVHVMPMEDMNFLSQTIANPDDVAVFNHITDRARRILDSEKRDDFLKNLGLK